MKSIPIFGTSKQNDEEDGHFVREENVHKRRRMQIPPASVQLPPKFGLLSTMHLLNTLALVANIVVHASATPVEVVKRQLGTATVSLAQPSGTPSQLASGFIYGIPDNGSSISAQIPDHFYTDIKFNYCRAGGAQLPAPSRGWIFGVQEFDVSHSMA